MTKSASEDIYVSMLGGFSISCDGRSVGESTGRTRRLWNLLGYLVTYRNKSISQDNLIEALWSDESSENPSNALKNLVYRVRGVLTESGIPNAREMVVLRKGSYAWNNALSCVIDTERFEQLGTAAADSSLSDGERIGLYTEAINLYKGDFMSPMSGEDWVLPLVNYYRSLYFKYVHELGLLLIRTEQYEKLCTLCERAVLIDPYEERAHKLKIYGLVKLGRSQEALQYYQYVTDLFYRELGVKPSKSMRNMYGKITKTVHSIEADIETIKEDLAEVYAGGAFYCDYEVFRNMYRLEARVAARTGQAVFLGLLTLLDENGSAPAVPVLAANMDKLLEVIHTSLRKGDVVSKFSASQYILMLPTLTFENGLMVMERIRKRFIASAHSGKIKIISSLKPLDPII